MWAKPFQARDPWMNTESMRFSCCGALKRLLSISSCSLMRRRKGAGLATWRLG